MAVASTTSSPASRRRVASTSGSAPGRGLGGAPRDDSELTTRSVRASPRGARMAPMATMSDTEVKDALADLPGWELSGSDISKEYKLADFAAAMAFVNQVAEAAEAANHHP